MNTPLIIRLLLRWHARYFVRVMYLALARARLPTNRVLPRTAQNSPSGDLIESSAPSPGPRRPGARPSSDSPAPLITAAFRGLLGRDPESEALATYSEKPPRRPGSGRPAWRHRTVREHWRRLLAVHAEAVVRAVFLALLKREPDPEAVAVYAQELRQTADLSALMSIIAESAEHWELLLQARASFRTATAQRRSAGVARRGSQLSKGVERTRGPTVSTGRPCLRRVRAGRLGLHPRPENRWHEPAEHACRHLWRPDRVSGARRHSLPALPGRAGAIYRIRRHFDLDSVAYIPRRTRRLFTFLREPRQRLLSLYRFLRAHEPTHPAFEGGKGIANRLDAVEFFRSVMALATRATSGITSPGASWDSADGMPTGKLLSGLDEPAREPQARGIRVEIRKRLQEFAFIGLQEDYPHSCQRLFELIGARVPRVTIIRSNHYR